VSRVRSLINFNVRALVVLPVDIWDQTKSTLTSEITEYNIHEKLRTKDFLKGIITNYSSNCSPSISDLENFVNKLVTYESGYTLVAAYLGRWLYKSGCKVDDVNYALLQAQNQPIRFLQNFIWSVILRKNYDLTKRFVIPLLAHVSLGDMTPKMATDLPLSLPSQHLLVKT
jgi:hypothetical protein